MHFRGEVRVISKGTKRIDGGMNENTGNQTAAAVKDRDQQKAHRNGKDDLAQIADQIHAVTVEQIDDMSDAESHAGNDDGRFHIVLCKGCEQHPPGRSLPPRIQRRAYTRSIQSQKSVRFSHIAFSFRFLSFLHFLKRLFRTVFGRPFYDVMQKGAVQTDFLGLHCV